MRCRLINRNVSFLCIQSNAAAADAAAALCVVDLLLFVIVCRMANFVADSLSLIAVFSSASFTRDFFLIVPLGSTLSHLRPPLAYILGNYGHARSQGGCQPTAAKPPLHDTIIYQVYYSSSQAAQMVSYVTSPNQLNYLLDLGFLNGQMQIFTTQTNEGCSTSHIAI